MQASLIPFLFILLKCGKEGGKLHKFEYLEKAKSFLNEKNIFHSF